QDRVQLGLKSGWSGLADLGRDGVPFLHPVLEATVQHRDLLVPKHPEHPPGTGGIEGTQLVPVVHHHVGVIPHAEASHVVGEVGFTGQHEVVGGGLVPTLLDIEEGRPGDVALPELLPGIPLLWRVPRRVQNPQ
ncbi:hypothetical protein N303_09873, partial [Cuculus canorus]